MNKRGSVFLNSEKLKCSSRRYSFLISIVSESSWCSEFSASYCYIHSFSLSVVFTLSLQYRQACGKANYLSSCFVVIIAVSIGKKKITAAGIWIFLLTELRKQVSLPERMYVHVLAHRAKNTANAFDKRHWLHKGVQVLSFESEHAACLQQYHVCLVLFSSNLFYDLLCPESKEQK